MQAFNNLTRWVGGICAQYLRDRLYEVFENHSNSRVVNNCCAALFGRRLDALACITASMYVSYSIITLAAQPTPFKDLAQLFHNIRLNGAIFHEFRLQKSSRTPATVSREQRSAI